jgi:hypothetical protein
MEKTRTGLTKWFLALYLIAHDKRGVSATRLSEELEVTYKTAWLMLHKIRQAMRKRDGNYMLTGIVEARRRFLWCTIERRKTRAWNRQNQGFSGIILEPERTFALSKNGGRPYY